METVRRIYVEKKEPFAVRAKELRDEIESYLGIGTEKRTAAEKEQPDNRSL